MAGLLFGQQGGGHAEGVQQQQVDFFGQGEADHEADEQRDAADHQPLAQLRQVIQQRRARGLDIGVVVLDAQEAAPEVVLAARFAAGLRALAGVLAGGLGGRFRGGGLGRGLRRSPLGAGLGRGFRGWLAGCGAGGELRPVLRLRRMQAVGEARVDLIDRVVEPQGAAGGLGDVVLGVAHGLHLAAQLVQLRLAGQVVEAGAELGGHAPHPGQERADLAHQHGQVLGPHHDQGDGGDDQDFRGADFGKHGYRFRSSPRRRGPVCSSKMRRRFGREKALAPRPRGGPTV